MKELPLLLNGEMVRATLDDRKTKTRRIVNSVQGIGRISDFQRSKTPGYDWSMRDKHMRWHELNHTELMERCPYGMPGDLLWVRETWQGYRKTSYEYDEWECIENAQNRKDYEGLWSWVYKADNQNFPDKWFPSIHMPRLASRITLRIASVTVERLQDINEEDAQAEGVILSYAGKGQNSYRAGFQRLWKSINGSESWYQNPWVWVIEFERVKP